MAKIHAAVGGLGTISRSLFVLARILLKGISRVALASSNHSQSEYYVSFSESSEITLFEKFKCVKFRFCWF